MLTQKEALSLVQDRIDKVINSKKIDAWKLDVAREVWLTYREEQLMV